MSELGRIGFMQRSTNRSARVPDSVARALDESAEDLRNDRIEDSDAYLKRMKARIDAYFSQKSDPTNDPKR